MKIIFLLLTLSFCITLNVNHAYGQGLSDTIFDRSANEAFAFGADISWGGSNLKDKNGIPKDLLTILKEQGLNAVRYRVWFPANGAHGKHQVVRQAKEAHNKGFKVMIDFHYSDSWADPGKQYIPSAWEGHTTDQLVQDVYNHTFDVLKALKDAGVTPAWVQIGNETKRGMLWPNGNTNDTPGGMDNFARMINSGYDAIKAIDSTIQAIVHLPDADENNLYRWMFDALKQRGVKWDIIGMSAYPRWAHLDWETEINRSVANMKDMISRYDTKVMVVETGHYWYEPYISNNFLVELMDTMMTFGGLGCFFWEPQAMFGYELTAWDPATRQPTIAMDAYLGIKHTDPASIIHVSLDEPTGGKTYQPDENITITASANHLAGEISKVTFYVNSKAVAEIAEEPYSYEFPNPGVGNYDIYATATDTSGIVVKSETVTVQVGVMTIFQENSDGYCGISNNAGTIDANHNNYTGAGFINSDNAVDVTVNWSVNFVGTGAYQIQFRYAGTSTRPGNVTINGKNIGVVPFESTDSWTAWDFSSVNYNVSEVGEVPISITSTTAEGLPNIDYMSVRSVDNTNETIPSSECLNHPGEVSSTVQNDALKPFTIYPVPAGNSLSVKSAGNIESIRIYRINGTLLKSITDIKNSHAEIPCKGMVPGVYIIQMMIDRQTHISRYAIYE
ncbi:MAG: glycosyl hydrolase 53 family protein [Prolixibacteraceae bacterium]|nr:glycosyl hydrolase 53 family protein [Prolixibacteraceae bacterium]